jgi:hypothetical protein
VEVGHASSICSFWLHLQFSQFLYYADLTCTNCESKYIPSDAVLSFDIRPLLHQELAHLDVASIGSVKQGSHLPQFVNLLEIRTQGD